MNDLLQKGMPASLEAERVVLGSLVMDVRSHDGALELLTPDDFSTEAHRRIFAALHRMDQAGKVVDTALLAHSLIEAKHLESVGGIYYLSELITGLPDLQSIESYVEIVKEKAALRRILYLTQGIMNRCLTPGESSPEIIAETEKALSDIGRGKQLETAELLTPMEVIERAGGIDKFLNPKQGAGVPTPWRRLTDMTSGYRRGELFVIAGNPSMGKAQPLYSKIQMADGHFKPMCSVKIGDEVASVDGFPSRIIGVHPQGKKEIYCVLFADGRSAHCCGDHLWEVRLKDSKTTETLKTTDLAKRIRTKRKEQVSISIPLVTGDAVPPANLSLDPWLMGALLGDGSLRRGALRISTADKEIVERVSACVAPSYKLTPNGKYGYAIVHLKGANRKGVMGVVPNDFVERLAAMGLLGTSSASKFIPTEFFTGSWNQRLELLHGLMDTDGTVEPSGTLRFTSVSRQLANDVERLVRSLGGMSHITLKRPFCTHKGERREGKLAYVVSIRHPAPPSLIWLPRKKIKALRSKHRVPRLTVRSITLIGTTEAQCITVSHPRGLYVTDNYTVTHNSAAALQVAMGVAESGEGALIFSLEMSRASLVQRMACCRARVDGSKLRAGYLNIEERSRLRRAISDFSHWPLWIAEHGISNVTGIRSALRRKKTKHGVFMIVIDYLQLLRGIGKFSNRNAEVSEITRSIKLLAVDEDVNVQLLSQLNRDNMKEKRGPALHDLRESGSIEQDADAVGFIWRPEMLHRDRDDLRGHAEFILGKQRNGPVGKIDLVWLDHITKLEDKAIWEPDQTPDMRFSHDD